MGRKWLLTAVAFVSAMLGALAGHEVARATLPAGPRVATVYDGLLVVGDSLTAGSRLAQPAQSFGAVLAANLRGTGQLTSAASIIRIGVSGQQMSDEAHLMYAYPSALHTSGAGHRDLVVIELGTNDWAKLTDLTVFKSNYATLLTWIHGNAVSDPSANLVVMGLWTSVGNSAGTAVNSAGVSINDFDTAIQAQASATWTWGTVAYVSLLSIAATSSNHTDPTADPTDGAFHPSIAGQSAIASAVQAVVP